MIMIVLSILLGALLLSTGCGELTKRGGAVPGRDWEKFDTLLEEMDEPSREEQEATAALTDTLEEPLISPVPEAEETIPPPEPEPSRSAALENQFVSGYRVQLLATKNPEEARNFAETVRPLFQENVYVEYIEPYYKVRAGDCPTREEAALLLRKARSHGFTDSWVTATLVIEQPENLR